MSLEFWKATNLTLSFFLELCALVAFADFGIHVGNTGILKTLLGIFIPLLVAYVWGRFLAPKSTKRLQGWPSEGLKLLIFWLSVGALWRTGLHSLATVFAVVVIVNRFFAYFWSQH